MLPPLLPMPSCSEPSFGQRSMAAFGGAIISAAVVNPMEVVKTRLQMAAVGSSSGSGGAARHGMLSVGLTIARREGTRALWRGSTVQALNAIPTVGFYFVVYDYTLRALARRCEDFAPSGALPALAGVSARSIAVVLSGPFENVRTQMYAPVEGGKEPATAVDIVRREIHAGGIRRLWRGLGPYFLRDVPFSAVYWTVLEHTRAFVLERAVAAPKTSYVQRPTWEGRANARMDARCSGASLVWVNFLCGAMSGCVAAFLTTPSDVVYVNRITSGMGTLPVVRRLWETEGARGFFKGAVPRVAKVAPTCATVIASYELLKKLLCSTEEKVG